MLTDSSIVPFINNETDLNTTIEPEKNTQDADSLAIALENISIILSVLGFLANLGTFTTLLKNGKDFSPTSRLLLQNQVSNKRFVYLKISV